MIIRPELLAPAGSPEAFHAAIAAGADAVYLGGKRFGARYFAANFDDESLAESVRYAHIRGIKVYVTMNTLVHDDEIPDVLQYLFYLCTLGIDAVLIQDLGILTLFTRIFSGLDNVPALHASTQMAVHNREGALFASEHGCSRIVLARELTAEEVRDIALALKERNAGVEIFIHGALCYAFSGQCLLSSVIGGRSGNRGMCAQPCRKPYEIFKGKPDKYGRLKNGTRISCSDKYPMSTRDLSLYPVLKMIPDLHVESLKIEGRMRSTLYVATVTGIYRKTIDSIYSGHFNPTGKDETDLALAFSRGFTTGYLYGNSYQQVMGRDLPGRRGILIGTVTHTDRNGISSINIAGNIIPGRGDGLVCISTHDEHGFILRRDPRIQGKVLFCDAGNRCKKGDQVFLTSRESLNHEVDNLLKKPDERFIGTSVLDLDITVSENGIVDISCKGMTRTGLSISHSYRSRHSFSPALSRPLSSSQIADALYKTGGTLYSIRDLRITCPDGLFVPVSILNAIRREIFEQVDEYIIRQNRPSEETLDTIRSRIEKNVLPEMSYDNNNPFYEDALNLISVVSDIESCEAALSAGADQVYVEWFIGRDRQEAIRTMHEILSRCQKNPGYREKTGIKLPKIILRSEMEILFEVIPEIYSSGIRHILVDGHGLTGTLAGQDQNFVISGFSGLNITNHLALISCPEYRFLTLSCELSGAEVRKTMNAAQNAGYTNPVAIICQGLIEVMVTRDNLVKLAGSSPSEAHVWCIRDQKGINFPFFTDSTGNTHIFNGKETSLIDKIPEIRRAGISILIIDARMRTPEYIHAMVTIYKKAISLPRNQWSPEISIMMKDEVRDLAWGDITAATWKRGLNRTEPFPST